MYAVYLVVMIQLDSEIYWNYKDELVTASDKKNWIIFIHCHKSYWKFNGFDTQRKWLFSLIIVVKCLLVLVKSH